MDIFGNFAKFRGDKDKRKVREYSDIEFSYSELATEAIDKVEEKSHLGFTSHLKLLSVLVFTALVLRLFVIQVVSGSANQKLAEGNRIRPRIIEANRGLILDKNGVSLAQNSPSFALAVYPSDLPKKKTDRLAIYQKIADLTSLPVDQIRTDAEKNGLSSLDEIIISDNISHDDALLLEQKINGLPGAYVATKSIRQYVSGSGMAHILGYTGIVSTDDIKNFPNYYLSDRIGKTGLESQYESALRGTHGVEQIEVDSKGNITRVLVDNSNKEPVSGDNLVLNVEFGLQQATSTALLNGMAAGTKQSGQSVTSGIAIVMNVQTGAILSMVSQPSYDNNLFSTKISQADYSKLTSDPTLPLFDRAIAGVYPPGSIVKIVMASAGLQEGTITANTSMVTPAAIKLGEYNFPDWKDHSYESTDIERAIAESNDIFFYAVGGGFDKIKGLGIDRIKKYWQLFGLGEKTGIDLPGEAAGLLPDNAWKMKTQNTPWYIGDTYHVSIGQGDLLVTPIQMLRATATIANGGKLLEPQLVNRIVDHSGTTVKEFDPRIERTNFISDSVIKIVQQGMRQAIVSGSVRSILADFPIPVAGKTGTAQFMNNAKTHAWFECYAPYDNPQIAVIVLVEGGGEGFDIAGPVAKDIMTYYFAQK
ncbi:MAG: penicillin-binding protein 2 [bacterium]|nr:penicillin-binding protein 2 [bacterium]